MRRAVDKCVWLVDDPENVPMNRRISIKKKKRKKKNHCSDWCNKKISFSIDDLTFQTRYNEPIFKVEEYIE